MGAQKMLQKILNHQGRPTQSLVLAPDRWQTANPFYAVRF